jgi:hypothetical protein
MDLTGTFKYRKVAFVNDGFDPEKTTDALYFNHHQNKRFEKLTVAIYKQIVDQQLAPF